MEPTGCITLYHSVKPAHSIDQAIRIKYLYLLKINLCQLNMEEISFFFTTNKNTSIFLEMGKTMPTPKTLSRLEGTLNPSEFIRANKTVYYSKHSVKNITDLVDSRLLITLDIEPPERIYISKKQSCRGLKPGLWMTIKTIRDYSLFFLLRAPLKFY